MVGISDMGPGERSENLVDDDDEHDGWGPIRPRRSSMPPDVSADPLEPAMPVRAAPIEEPRTSKH